jgi:uncharacterized membrane protein
MELIYMILFFYVLTGISCIIVGVYSKLFPRTKINEVSGYRTYRSMKNQDTWDEGNRYSSTMTIYGGILSTILSLIIFIIVKDQNESIIEHGAEIAAGLSLLIGLIFPVLLTEIHLKKMFNERGEKKIK